MYHEAKKETSMFPVACCGYCILGSKFARSVCLFFTQIQEKIKVQNDFLPWTCWKHQLRLCGKSNIWGCVWLICEIYTKNGWFLHLWYCFVCVFLCSVDKKIGHCCFSIDKIRSCIAHSSFWTYYWKHICVLFWPDLKTLRIWICMLFTRFSLLLMWKG